MFFRTKVIAPAITAVLLFPVIPACNSPHETPRSAATPAAWVAPENETVQKVNGTPITKKELQRAVKELVHQRHLMQPLAPELHRQVTREALERLVSQELLYQAAGHAQSGELEQQVAQRVAATRALMGEAEFRKNLGEDGLILPDLQQLIRKDLVVERFIERRFGTRVALGEPELRNFYEENRISFKTGSSVRISRILIGSGGRTGAARQDAREKAETLLKRVREGENFGVLAREHSNCPSKMRGGDLGFCERGGMDPRLEQAVFALRPGEVSAVVETASGFHILKVTEKRAPRLETYEEARPKIVQRLRREKVMKLVSDYLRELRLRARLEKG